MAQLNFGNLQSDAASTHISQLQATDTYNSCTCVYILIVWRSQFQVFVYSPEIYSRIKLRLKSQPISQISKTELTSYFSPWFAEHIGSVQTASGNASVEAWASSRLRNSFYFLRYANLLNLHGDAKLLAEVDGLLKDEAVVQLDLKSMASTINDVQRRQWFSDVVDNYLKLWEVNMWGRLQLTSSNVWEVDALRPFFPNEVSTEAVSSNVTKAPQPEHLFRTFAMVHVLTLWFRLRSQLWNNCVALSF